MATEIIDAETEKMEGQGDLGKFLAKKCPSGEITKENEGMFMGFRNHLQLVLAMRKFGDTPDHSAEEMWLSQYSTAFGAAFDKIVDEDPLFFDDYATLGDILEEKWIKLEREVDAQRSLLEEEK